MSSGWSGHRVRKARQRLAATLPAPCWRCGRIVTDESQMVAGHLIERDVAPWLMDDPANQAVECKPCSDRSGAIYGNRKRGRARAQAKVTSRDW